MVLIRPGPLLSDAQRHRPAGRPAASFRHEAHVGRSSHRLQHACDVAHTTTPFLRNTCQGYTVDLYRYPVGVLQRHKEDT